MADGRASVSVKEKGENKVSVPRLELGSMTSRPSSESVRALQGSVDSVHKEFSSTIGDSGLKGSGAAQTSGSPDEEGISGLQKDTAGEHLDQETNKALSEGDAAVKPASSDDVDPNVERVGVSAAEELVVKEVPGTHEVTSEGEEGVEKLQEVLAEETSQPIAKVSAVSKEEDFSADAGDTVDMPGAEVKAKAWSTNEVRANAQKTIWSAEEARVEAHVVSCSADDCNNGAQVSVVADDGGSQVDALVQLEVGGEEQNDEGRTEANGAASGRWWCYFSFGNHGAKGSYSGRKGACCG